MAKRIHRLVRRYCFLVAFGYAIAAANALGFLIASPPLVYVFISAVVTLIFVTALAIGWLLNIMDAKDD